MNQLFNPFDKNISVIIPTTCEKHRKLMLKRAVESVLAQSGLDVELILVVNGDHFDREMLESYKSNKRISIIQIAEGNVSVARFIGLQVTKHDFFCFLDDDDEFLIGGLKRRVELFAQFPHADVIVTNGYSHKNFDVPLVNGLSEVEINNNPGATILKFNWFASLAPTFRKTTVDDSFFKLTLAHFEWTYIFFLLSSSGKIILYNDCFTYRRYENNPSSASKSLDYAKFYPQFLKQLRELPLDVELQQKISMKYVAALNGLSNLFLENNNYMGAWYMHLKCLRYGGWRFLPYTRHLFSYRRIN